MFAIGIYKAAFSCSVYLLLLSYLLILFLILQAGFTGIGVGSAFYGLKPIVEFMTFNFAMQVVWHVKFFLILDRLL